MQLLFYRDLQKKGQIETVARRKEGRKERVRTNGEKTFRHANCSAKITFFFVSAVRASLPVIFFLCCFKLEDLPGYFLPLFLTFKI